MQQPAARAPRGNDASSPALTAALSAVMQTVSGTFVSQRENEQRWSANDSAISTLNTNVVKLTEAVNALTVNLARDYLPRTESERLEQQHREDLRHLEDKIDALGTKIDAEGRSTDNKIAAQGEGLLQRSISLWQGLVVSAVLILFSICASWAVNHIGIGIH